MIKLVSSATVGAILRQLGILYFFSITILTRLYCVHQYTSSEYIILESAFDKIEEGILKPKHSRQQIFISGN